MLLSIDWDAYSGTREFVFDAPIWGTPDRQFDQYEAWQVRKARRDNERLFQEDFPLYDGWQALLEWNVPTFAASSHASAYEWVKQWPNRHVLNIDSHHDLYSQSGDTQRVRAGNWAGLALLHGLIRSYTCQYPNWHGQLAVAEGYDLERTHAEIADVLSLELRKYIQLQRSDLLPDPKSVEALILIQSPAWCNPMHDRYFLELVSVLNAEIIEPLRDHYILL